MIVGDCCADEYCDCSDNSVQSCGPGQVFCPVYNGGSCMLAAVVGGDCQALGGNVCCSSESSSTSEKISSPISTTIKSTKATTTTEFRRPPDCDALCAAADGANAAGDCCAAEGCNCGDNSVLTCGEGHYFCPQSGYCDVYGNQDECLAAWWCCN